MQMVYKKEGQTAENKKAVQLVCGAFEAEASFTLEATFLVPLVFFLLFTVIWYSFFLHDRIAADAWAAYTAEECRMGAQYGRAPYSGNIELDGYKGEDGREKMLDRIKDKNLDAMSRMFMADAYAACADADGNEVTVSLNVQGKNFNGLLMSKLFKRTEIEENRKYGTAGKWSRGVTMLFRVGKKVLGV